MRKARRPKKRKIKKTTRRRRPVDRLVRMSAKLAFYERFEAELMTWVRTINECAAAGLEIGRRL